MAPKMDRSGGLLALCICILLTSSSAFGPLIKPPSLPLFSPLPRHSPVQPSSSHQQSPLSPLTPSSSSTSTSALHMSPSPSGSSAQSLNPVKPLLTGRNFDMVTNAAEDEKMFYDVFHPEGEDDGRPAVLYLPNLVRGKNDVKSSSLQNRCKRSKLTFLCADYHGVVSTLFFFFGVASFVL